MMKARNQRLAGWLPSRRCQIAVGRPKTSTGWIGASKIRKSSAPWNEQATRRGSVAIRSVCARIAGAASYITGAELAADGGFAQV